MAPALYIAGAVLVIAGTALLCWPAALIVAGVLALLAATDLTLRPTPSAPTGEAP